MESGFFTVPDPFFFRSERFFLFGVRSGGENGKIYKYRGKKLRKAGGEKIWKKGEETPLVGAKFIFF